MAPPTKLAISPRRRRVVKKTNVPKLRSSITPGTVLILLRGVNAGRRVVFVKQLPGSGQLLVTGPKNINGVPFTRVSQSSVIATSTKINIAAVKAEGINDGLFKSSVRRAAKKSEADFFQNQKPTEEKRKAQNLITKAADAAIIGEIKKVPLLKQYLSRNFFLKKGDRPHLLKF